MSDLPRSGTPEDKIEDPDFGDEIIQAVEEEHLESKVWGISYKGGLGGAIPKVEGMEPPQPGDRVRLWPKPLWGSRIRGIALRGIVLRYLTEEEARTEDQAEIAESQAKEKLAYEEGLKASQQARYEALPEVFRKRIDVRRRNNPDFGWRFEDYELFSCEQAAAFAHRAREANMLGESKEIKDYFENREAQEVPPTPETRWLYWWRDLSSPEIRDFDRQRAEMPAMSDNHSGNTFGIAFSLAVIWLIHGEEGVIKQHGAMAPIVGSVEYGDLTQEEADALAAEESD